jgi:hypothetical protein
VVYRVEPVGEDVAAAVDALQSALLTDFAELRVALEVSPWTVGWPYVTANPGGMRIVEFGTEHTATVVFGVIERDRLVTILQVAVY